jgi:hypothetical protein
MRGKIAVLAGLAAGVLASAPALAREHQDYEDLFFMRAKATAQGFFQDRSSCRYQAAHVSDNAAEYTEPEYGALSAMGSALDEYQLHEGGLHKRLQQAAFTECMEHLGWTPADLTPEEIRELKKADPRHPELLDAWLKTHEPPPEPVAATAAKPAPPAKPAATAPPAAKASS